MSGRPPSIGGSKRIDFAGPLAVHYRLFNLNAGSTAAPVSMTATIAPGAASVTIPQPLYGYSIFAYAGEEYTTALDENSDVVQGW